MYNDIIIYNAVSCKKTTNVSIVTRHSRPTFTAGSSWFAIIFRTYWQVVLSRCATSLTVRVSLMPLGHSSAQEHVVCLQHIQIYALCG